MMTPYGAPSPYAYIIPVPNDTVGLIIGKNGETIRKLQNDSGAKIQVAKVPIRDKNIRNVFVEAEHEKYILAKESIDKIIADHKRANDPQIFIGE
jgi:far upstream element-binding protein